MNVSAHIVATFSGAVPEPNWHLGEVVRVERARNVRHLQAEDTVFERLQSVERVGDLDGLPGQRLPGRAE
jgi:hypothetical protein